RTPLPVAELEVLEMPEPRNTPEVDDADADPAVALYAAARSGRVERALALLGEGADPRALPDPDGRDQRALPVLAAVLPDLRLLRALITGGVDLNHAHAGLTPPQAATRHRSHGRPESVMTLLSNRPPPGVAALLHDAAAEVDAHNLEGVTPLGIACGCGNWRIARFLLERGARTEPEGGSPPLLAAAGGEDDDVAGVALLLKHKAKLDARDAQGRSALHEAALAGHVETMAALIEAGADADARDRHGRSPLHEAAVGGHTAALDLLAGRADLH